MAGPGDDGRQWFEALTFWSRANTLVMGLLRIAVALYSAVLEGPKIPGPGSKPWKKLPPDLLPHH